MKPIRGYLHPQGNFDFLHDADSDYIGLVPFSKRGLIAWVDQTSEADSEFTMLGQINDRMAHPYPVEQFGGLHDRMIVDLEGDEVQGTFRQEFLPTLKSVNCAPVNWDCRTTFPRPTFSKLLVFLARNRKLNEQIHGGLKFTKCPHLWFRGFPDKRAGVRWKLYRASQGIENVQVELTTVWNGPSDPNSNRVMTYFEGLAGCSAALCPQGNGVCTARFYEACCLGRWPIVIGNHLLLGQDQHDTSFVTRIASDISIEQLKLALELLSIAPMRERIERGRSARAYWEEVCLPYFEDPTLRFLEWLERNGHR